MPFQIDVAIGLILRDHRILICRRREQDPLGGYWEFPGGKCEPGESAGRCVARELEEELGVIVCVREPLPTIEYDYPNARVRLHPFICALERGEPVPLVASESRWIAPRDLGSYTFPPANDRLLESLTRRFDSTLALDGTA